MSGAILKTQMIPHPTDLSVEGVIVLIDELIAVIEKENAELARGIPAAISPLVAKKAMLASRFEYCVTMVRERRVKIPPANLAQRDRLALRTEELRMRMAENVQRLQVAIEASRRRVEAVMNAIRQHAAEESPYSAKGRATAPRVINGNLYRQA